MTLRYKIKYLDYVSKHDMVEEKGFCYGASYGEAIEKLIHYYGEDAIDMVQFYIMDDHDGVVTDEDLEDEF